jgi:TatD DNase family protein
MILIDTHAHLYLPHFADDIDQVICNAIDSKVVKVLLPNIDTDSVSPMLDLCRKFPLQCHPMIGLHPASVGKDYRDKLSQLESMIGNEYFTAIGETGMDAYWDIAFLKEQKESFIMHLEWAKQMDIPVVIHSRETMDIVLEVLKTQKGDRLRGVFHAFSGTPEQAGNVIDLGFKLGIGGVVTYKNSGLSPVIESLDLENFILETDSPYLTPVPNRGKRNESANLLLIAKKIAEIKDIPLKKLPEQQAALLRGYSTLICNNAKKTLYTDNLYRRYNRYGSGS